MSISDNTPARPIPLAVPYLGGNEWEYVKDCLDTNWVSSVGPYVDRFERLAAESAGTEHAVATVNGTAALHIALLVAGVKPDDEVIVSDLTFIASANAVRYANAWPVFLDVDPDYWQLDPAKLAEFCEQACEWHAGALRNKATGRRIAAIVPVHILGHPVDLDAIREIARRYDLPVIADAAEAIGASYKGRPIGVDADLSCLSFNGNKIITTGGGGMIVTNDAAMAAHAKHLTTQAKSEPLEYIHDEVGFNYRLTNLQAAVGCAQLERLAEHVEAKRRIAAGYAAAFANLPGLMPMKEAPWAYSTYWLYTVLVDPQTFGCDCRDLLRILAADRIQARPLWQPMHLSPAHAGSPSYGIAVSTRLYAQALSLPCSVGLTAEDQQRVIAAVRGAAQGV